MSVDDSTIEELIPHVLILLRLLLCGSSGVSSDGMSYVEGRWGSLFRALPGVRCDPSFLCEFVCEEVCDACGVEVPGTGCV